MPRSPARLSQYPPGMAPSPPSARTAVRRLPERGAYDRATADAILDEGLVAHVGLATDHGPVVIPLLYARDGGRVLLHGSPAAGLLRGGKKGADLCLTVTLLDGLVLARSAFHHSVNYRSVVVFGTATPVADLDGKRAALDVLVQHVVPGRIGGTRPPSDEELRSTLVLALPLDEFSVKVRTGDPKDEPDDMDLPYWAGVVPLATVPGAPVTATDLRVDAPVPAYAAAYARP